VSEPVHRAIKCLACSHPSVFQKRWCREHLIEVQYVKQDPSIEEGNRGFISPRMFRDMYGVGHDEEMPA